MPFEPKPTEPIVLAHILRPLFDLLLCRKKAHTILQFHWNGMVSDGESGEHTLIEIL